MKDTFITTIRRSKRAALVALLQLDTPWLDTTVTENDISPYPGTTCNRCGKCCKAPYRATIHPGEIWNWIHEERLGLLEHVVAIRIDDQPAKFAFQYKNEAGMEDSLDCVFLDSKGSCNAYPVRPLSCRVYPESMLVNAELPACDPSCFTGEHPLLNVAIPLQDSRCRAADEHVVDAWGKEKWDEWVLTVVKGIRAWLMALKVGE